MKKLVRVLLASVMLMSVCMMSVSALGSAEKPGAIGDWTAYDPEGTEYDHVEYELVFDEREIQDIDRHTEELRNLMASVNAGETSMMDYLKNRGIFNQLPNGTQSVGMFMEIRDLIVRRVDTKEKVDAYDVTVTFEVPGLVEGMGEVWVYHHSTNNHTDELIKPISVDYANKAVTCAFKDLCPISVIYVKKAQKPVDTSAVDYTGLFGLISVAAGAAFVATGKKNKKSA